MKGLFYFNSCSMPTNLTFAQLLFFLWKMFTEVPKLWKPLGTDKNLRNCCQHLKTAWLNTESLVMAANFNLGSSFSPSQKLPNPKYSSAAQGYMRICNWGVMFLLLWVILFSVWRSVFRMFKSSNLIKETDNWSLVSANDCLLMLYANTHLWLWDRDSFQFSFAFSETESFFLWKYVPERSAFIHEDKKQKKHCL